MSETVVRRAALATLAVLALGILWWEGYADTPRFDTYHSPELGFTISVPQSWRQSYSVETGGSAVVFLYKPSGDSKPEPLFTINALPAGALPTTQPYLTRTLATAESGTTYAAVWLANAPYGKVDAKRYNAMARDITNVLNSFRLVP